MMAAVNKQMRKFKRLKADVLVIGGGAAGLRAAFEAAEAGADVLLLNKGVTGQSGYSFYPLTPGWGMQVAQHTRSDTDSPEEFYKEIMDAGKGMCDPKLAQILVEDSQKRYRDLAQYGISFKKKGGKLLRVEGCFSRQPRAVVAWDMANIRESFLGRLKESGVRTLDRVMAVKLIKDGDRCAGAVAVSRRGGMSVITAGAVILATGGGGQLFEYSFSTPEQTGDSYVLAYDAGATLKNIEFIQLVYALQEPVRKGLFPEMLFGKRPAIRNEKGEEFLRRYFDDGAARKDAMTERGTHGPFSAGLQSARIDIGCFEEAVRQIDEGAPSLGAELKFNPNQRRSVERDIRVKEWLAWLAGIKKGFDFWKSGVKILHHAHAFNGGIEIGENGETGVEGLYACGEAAAGMHGADRLGGAMIAATQVFGARAGAAAAKFARGKSPAVSERAIEQAAERALDIQGRADGRAVAELKKAAQKICWRNLNVSRSAAGLMRNLDFFYGASLESCDRTRRLGGIQPLLPFEAENMVRLGKLITLAALRRQESRGAHFRSDFPGMDDENHGEPTRLNVNILTQEGVVI